MLENKPPSPVFIILTAFLAINLFFYSVVTIPTAAAAIPALIIIGIVAAAVVGAFIAGWFLATQQSNQQINPDNYAVLVGREHFLSMQQLMEFTKTDTQLIGKATIQYSRLAAYRSIDYVGQNWTDSVERAVMQPVARDLCNVWKNHAASLHKLLNDLQDYVNGWSGTNLESYGYVLRDWDTGSANPLYIKPNTGDIGLYGRFGGSGTVSVLRCQNPDNAYVEQISVNANDVIDLVNNVPFGGINVITFGRDILTVESTDTGAYATEFAVIKNNADLEVVGTIEISRLFGLMSQIKDMYEVVLANAKAEHSLLSSNYDSPQDVPPDAVCPPPDIVLPVSEQELQQNAENYKDPLKLLALYYVYVEALNATVCVREYDPDQLTVFGKGGEALNVTIDTGTQQIYVKRIIPLDAVCQYELAAGNNTIPCYTRILVEYSDGSFEILQLSAGTVLVVNEGLRFDEQNATTIIVGGEHPLAQHELYDDLFKGLPPLMLQMQANMQLITQMINLLVAIVPLLIIISLLKVVQSVGK